LYILRNGVDVKEFAYKETGNSKVICLGKIEPRKRQAFLAKELDGKIAIDFIGPQVDEKFVTGVTTKQIGSWTREQVRTELTHYSSLILLSDGEAAPMVAIEALASGVSLVISQTASANINPTLPFVKIVPNNIEGTMLVKILKESIAQNAFHREAIRQYAEKFFDFPVILEEYLTIIENFASQTKRVFPKPYTDVRYFYSKAWRFMAKLYRQFR
jgi:glycosyltransferase involved in cell wall biosynthesis